MDFCGENGFIENFDKNFPNVVGKPWNYVTPFMVPQIFRTEKIDRPMPSIFNSYPIQMSDPEVICNFTTGSASKVFGP